MPSQGASPIQSCAVTQAYLATQNQPGNGALNLGFIESLYSPQNRTGFTLVTQNGKGYPDGTNSCKVQVKYLKPDCGEVGNDTKLCPAPQASTLDVFGTAQFEFDPDTDILSLPYSVSEEQFNCSCDPMDTVMPAALNQKLRRIFAVAEQRLLDQAWDCLGPYCNGLPSNVAQNIQTANIFSSNGNTAQPGGWWFVLDQQSKMKYTGNPIVVGGSAIQKYLWYAAHAGLGAGAVGANPAAALGIDLYYSSEFDAWAVSKGLPAGDYAIVYMPGTMQHVSYVDNVGDHVWATPTSARTTLEFSNNGRNYMVDYETYHEEKCREWQILPKLTSGLFCLPDDNACANYEGTGRFLISLGCGDVGCEPICTPVS